MARFTASVDLNMRLPGGFEAIGVAGSTYRIPDELADEFARDVAPGIPGFVWITQDESTAIPSLPLAQSDVTGLTASLGGKYDKTGGTISGSVTATGSLSVGGRLSVIDPSTERIPVNIAAEVSGPTAVANGTSDTICINLSPRLQGNFTGLGGVDPGFVWGVNNFTTIGQEGATGGAGIHDATALLSEMAVISSSGLSASSGVRALHADISFFGASAGGHIASMESLRVTPPHRKNGATGGTATNTYGIIVESPGTVGSSGNFAIYTEGGPSRFTGRLDVENVTGFTGAMELAGNFTRGLGSALRLDGNDAGGNIVQYLSTTGAYVGVSDNTTVVHKLNRSGSIATGGTAFPASPAANDLYYRTDRDLLYFYDGTRWLTTTLYQAVLPIALNNLTASTSETGHMPFPPGGHSLYVEAFRTSFFIGTTNSSTAYWSLALKSYNGNTPTTLATNATSASSANVWTAVDGTVNTVVSPATFLTIDATKTNSPGSIKFTAMVTYRLVG